VQPRASDELHFERFAAPPSLCPTPAATEKISSTGEGFSPVIAEMSFETAASGFYQPSADNRIENMT
jgi:hypothetical protein